MSFLAPEHAGLNLAHPIFSILLLSSSYGSFCSPVHYYREQRSDIGHFPVHIIRLSVHKYTWLVIVSRHFIVAVLAR